MAWSRMGRFSSRETFWWACWNKILYVYCLPFFVSLLIDWDIDFYGPGKSDDPTAGSFVRPTRPADKPRGFLEALHEKYASEFEEEFAIQQQRTSSLQQDSIKISGKIVEEVGFDKIRKKLAELKELKVVLLDHLCIAGVVSGYRSPEEAEAARKLIGRTCPKIRELDLSWNLLSRWRDVFDICGQLPLLRQLKLKYVSNSSHFFFFFFWEVVSRMGSYAYRNTLIALYSIYWVQTLYTHISVITTNT